VRVCGQPHSMNARAGQQRTWTKRSWCRCAGAGERRTAAAGRTPGAAAAGLAAGPPGAGPARRAARARRGSAAGAGVPGRGGRPRRAPRRHHTPGRHARRRLRAGSGVQPQPLRLPARLCAGAPCLARSQRPLISAVSPLIRRLTSTRRQCEGADHAGTHACAVAAKCASAGPAFGCLCKVHALHCVQGLEVEAVAV
jgi:hypothetical protein